MSGKLTSENEHLMKLIDRDKKEDGWTSVNKIVAPLVSSIPSELVIFEPSENGGRAKLTEAGQIVLYWD